MKGWSWSEKLLALPRIESLWFCSANFSNRSCKESLITIMQPKTPLSPPSPRESFWKSLLSATIVGFAILMFFYAATVARKGLTSETYDFFKEYLKRCLENISQGDIKKYLIPTETWISAATISLTTIKQKQWSDIRNYTTGQLEQEIKKKKALFYAISSLATAAAVIAAIGTVCLYRNPSVETWFLCSVLWFAFYVISCIPSFMTGDNIELSLTYVEAIKALGRSYGLSDGLQDTKWGSVSEGVSEREESRASRVKEWFKQFKTVPVWAIVIITIITVCLLCFKGYFSVSVAMIAIVPLVLILFFKILVVPTIVRRFVVGGDIGLSFQVILYIEIFLFVFVSSCVDEFSRHKMEHPEQSFMNVFNTYGAPIAALLWMCVALSLCSAVLVIPSVILPKSIGWPRVQKVFWSRSFDLCHTKLFESNYKFCRETRGVLKGVSVDKLIESIESEHLSEDHKKRYADGKRSATPQDDAVKSSPCPGK